MSRDTPINHYESDCCCCCCLEEQEFNTPSPPPAFRDYHDDDNPPSYNEATNSENTSSDIVIITPQPPPPIPPEALQSPQSSVIQSKLSCIPVVPKKLKQWRAYTTFKNEVISHDGGSDDGEHSRFVRKWVGAVAGVDLILFATSLILAITTEKYLCYDGPIRLDYSYDSVAAGVFNDSSTSPSSSSELDDITERLTVYEYFKDIVLKELMLDSPGMYHIVVICLLALALSYFLLEIWLFCVLVKVGQTRRVSYCLKWICWRSVLLSLTVLVSLFDMIHAHQATCSELILGPFQIVRVIVGGIPVAWVVWNSSSSGVGWSTRQSFH